MPETFLTMMEYLEGHEGPLAYLILGLAASLEYVFPPFPGDSITLFGVFLSVHVGYSIPLVYVAITVGSVLGGVLAYSFGVFLGEREEKWPAMLRRPGAKRAIERVRLRFERHGAFYLALNRFLPALRAFFFVAAGMSRMPLSRVVLFGGISAALWNAALLAAGYAIGENFEALAELSRRYTIATLVLVVFVALAVWLRGRAAARRDGARSGP